MNIDAIEMMARRLADLEARATADELLINALIDRLIDGGQLSPADLITPLARFMDAPKSVLVQGRNEWVESIVDMLHDKAG